MANGERILKTVILAWLLIFERIFAAELIDQTAFLGECESDKNTVILLRFNEGNGGICRDESPNGKNGILKGVVTPAWVKTKYKTGLQFDGSSSYVEVPDAGVRDPLRLGGNMTIEAWVCPTGAGKGGTPAVISKFSGAGGFCVYTLNDRVTFQLRHNSETFKSIMADAPLATNAWCHIMAVLDDNEMKLFLNGVRQKQTAEWSETYSCPEPCLIGRMGDDCFQGIIDEVRISNMVRVESSGAASANAAKKDMEKEDWKALGLTDITRANPRLTSAQARSFLSFEYQAKNILDKNLNTHWVSSLVGGEELLIVLGTPTGMPHLISGMQWLGNNLSGVYAIKISADGLDWKTVAERINIKPSFKRTDFFKPTLGSFVKIEFKESGRFFLSLAEVRILSGYHNKAEYRIEEKPAINDENKMVCHFQAQKILYRPGEKVSVKAAFNFPDKNGKYHVKLFEQCGIRNKREVAGVVLPGNAENYQFSLDPGGIEYAHFLRLLVYQDNQEIARGETLFEVCENWLKVIRICNTPGYILFNEKYPDDARNWIIAKMREYNYNCFEPAHGTPAYGNFCPENEVWSDPPVYFTHNTLGGYAKWRHALRQNGIKIMNYIETTCTQEKLLKKEWKIYPPLRLTDEEIDHLYGGDPGTARAQNKMPRGAPIGVYSGMLPDEGAMTNPDFMRQYAGQFARAVKLFDNDAVFFDDFTRHAAYSARGSDGEGNPLTSKTPDQVGAAFLLGLQGDLAKENKKIVYVCNNLALGMAPGFRGKDFRRQVIAEKLKISHPLTAQIKDIVWVHEGADWFHKKEDTRYPHTYQELSRMLQGIKQLGRVRPLGWWFPPGGETLYPLPNFNIMRAVVLANGCGYSSYLDNKDPNDCEISRSAKKYIAFAVRYEEYLNDMDIHWLPDGEFMCQAPDAVYWRDLCFERKISEDRIERYLHLINLPGEDVSVKYDRAAKEVRNVAFEAVIPSGYTVKTLAWMSPDGQEDPVDLPCERRSETAISASIPFVKYWSMVALRMEKTEINWKGKKESDEK
ncbi:MAG: hypothetical protein PHV34_06275 [Verrucomicrobiae bacterium]|nr:hypothetical protein [Verrucomicrobiae bacterium]